MANLTPASTLSSRRRPVLGLRLASDPIVYRSAVVEALAAGAQVSTHPYRIVFRAEPIEADMVVDEGAGAIAALVNSGATTLTVASLALGGEALEGAQWPHTWTPASTTSVESARDEIRMDDKTLETVAEASPDALLALILTGRLSPVSLTFAAEIAGGIDQPDVVVPVVARLLKHTSAVVREGAIYGLAKQEPSTIIRDHLRDLLEHEQSAAVRQAAGEVLASFDLDDDALAE